MPLVVKNTAKPRELCAEGSYSGICIAHYDIGTRDSQYGKNHQVVLVFELDETNSEGVRFTMSHFTGLNLGARGQLGKLLKNWLGLETPQDGEFDTSTLLGKHALVQVEHVIKDGDVNDRIRNIIALPRSMNPITTAQPLLDYSPINPHAPFPEAMPDWVKQKCREADEWIAVHGPPTNVNGSQKPQQQQARPGLSASPMSQAEADAGAVAAIIDSSPIRETIRANDVGTVSASALLGQNSAPSGLANILQPAPVEKIPPLDEEAEQLVKILGLPLGFTPGLIDKALSLRTDPDAVKKQVRDKLMIYATPF